MPAQTVRRARTTAVAVAVLLAMLGALSVGAHRRGSGRDTTLGAAFIADVDAATNGTHWLIVEVTGSDAARWRTATAHICEHVPDLWQVLLVLDQPVAAAAASTPSRCHVLQPAPSPPQPTSDPAGAGSRRNAAYVFAVQHGATVLYDLDMRLRVRGNGFRVETAMAAADPVLYWHEAREGVLLADVYGHFGWPQLYARGMGAAQPPWAPTYAPPLAANATSSSSTRLTVPDAAQAPLPLAIVQRLVDLTPDIDAASAGAQTAFLTQPPQSRRFCADVPAVALAPGLFGPLNAQNTLFHAPALWAAFEPALPTASLARLWRGLWAQRLLWDAGLALVVQPATAEPLIVVDDVSAGDSHGIAAAELLAALSFLAAWRGTAPTFSDRVIELMSALVAAGFVPPINVALVRAWVAALLRAGYRFPAIVTTTTTHAHATPEAAPLPDALRDRLVRCAWRRAWSPVLHAKFRDVAVGVHMNRPVADVIPRYLDVYGPAFPTLVFFGPTQPEDSSSVPYDVTTYLASPDDFREGSLQYGALLALVDRFPNAAGYLHTNDDAFLNYWRLAQLSLDVPWYPRWDTNCNPSCLPYGTTPVDPTTGFCHAGCASYDVVARQAEPPVTAAAWWDHWDAESPAMQALVPQLPCWAVANSHAAYGDLDAFALFRSTTTCINPFNADSVNAAALNLDVSAVQITAAQASFRFFNGGADVIYLDRQSSVRVLELLRLFLRAKLFVEIAVPSAIAFSLPLASLYPLHTQYRSVIQEPTTYDQLVHATDLDVFHPVKLRSDPELTRAVTAILQRDHAAAFATSGTPAPTPAAVSGAAMHTTK